ncbi:MAG: UDP-3-O-acyl-N-acetylglucosamine deacetylase [Fibrobacteraceae bacterium]|mgnify:CR=1 FL=1|nr:UDP-3-O-acyl-N-acetylglucosamine deacetylase [Fibrobacteraceae bacterium]
MKSKFPRHQTFTSPSLSLERASVQIEVLEKNVQKEPAVNWYVNNRFFYSTSHSYSFSSLAYSAKRTSTYTGENALSTPEHLAPVFLMWPSRTFNVYVENAEIPLMDGSALPFFLGLRNMAGVPEELEFYKAPVKDSWNICDGNGVKCGFVEIFPSECFEVEYSVERRDQSGATIFESYRSAEIYSPENLYNIFKARTFILQEDFERARESGFLTGVTEKNGLLLQKNKETQTFTPSAPFRSLSEPAEHKILDLIGDLCFVVPALPQIKIVIHNGGHLEHHKIMEKILPYVSRRNNEKK